MDLQSNTTKETEPSSTLDATQPVKKQCKHILKNKQRCQKLIGTKYASNLQSGLCAQHRQGRGSEEEPDFDYTGRCEHILKNIHRCQQMAARNTTRKIALCSAHQGVITNQVPAREFYLFRKLAQELKDLIWGFTLPRGRIIKVREAWYECVS